MNRQLPVEDTVPWYRQFWPWFIIALPTAVVIAAFVTLYIANEHSDDVVVNDYYKEGLAINQRLAGLERAVQLGISAELEFTNSTVYAMVNGDLASPALTLLLSHPMEADRDLRLTLSRSAPGNYQAALPRQLSQRWHWSLLQEGEQGWRIDGTATLD